ncbi:MAG: Fpg/Nei family DNA glycosylase [Microbacteriaceae bacterium]|nr:MAG: Fpg/Nei family DNA glycosylase [Microbacteriaceae bacterium]
MPESPEVQALVEFAAMSAVGRVIREFEIVDFSCYKSRGAPPDILTGARLGAVRRHGKYVDVEVAAGDGEHRSHLIVGFGRHGWLVWDDGASSGAEWTSRPELPYAVGRVGFDDGTGFDVIDGVQFRSVGMWVVDDPSDVPAIARLGPDPLDPDFTREQFDRPIVGRRKQLKAVLQEQESFAGIGNAYSDEILFRARLSPVIHAAALSPDHRDWLYETMIRELREAVDARRGIRIDRLKAVKVAAMAVHGRAGQPCPGCGGRIRDFTFSGTTAQYCPSCQTGGTTL